MSDDPPFDGFAMGPIPIPPELLEMFKKQHDRDHLHQEATQARVENFISGLDVDGLMALRTILCTGDMVKSLSANFWDGQIVGILKYVHHVDPMTGKDPMEIFDAEGAENG